MAENMRKNEQSNAESKERGFTAEKKETKEELNKRIAQAMKRYTPREGLTKKQILKGLKAHTHCDPRLGCHLLAETGKIQQKIANPNKLLTKEQIAADLRKGIQPDCDPGFSGYDSDTKLFNKDREHFIRILTERFSPKMMNLLYCAMNREYSSQHVSISPGDLYASLYSAKKTTITYEIYEYDKIIFDPAITENAKTKNKQGMASIIIIFLGANKRSKIQDIWPTAMEYNDNAEDSNVMWAYVNSRKKGMVVIVVGEE